MPGPPLNRNVRVTIRDVVGHGFIILNLRPQLIVVDHLKISAVLDISTGGRQLAEEQLNQRRLARAVGSNQTNFISANNRRREILHQQLTVRVSKSHFFYIDDLHAARDRFINPHVNIADRRPPGPTIRAQDMQLINPRRRPRTLRFHSAANPLLFLRELFIGERLRSLLRL